MRRKYIIANWKANPDTLAEAKILATETFKVKSKAEVVVAAPTAYLAELKKQTTKLAAQDFFDAERGAYTSQVTVPMLKSLKINYAIIGHSEVKQENGDTNLEINKKIHLALATGIKPIVCLGEKNKYQVRNILKKQFNEYFEAIDKKYIKNVVLCWEPVWAISKGKKNSTPATFKDINSAIGYLRKLVARKYSKSIASEISILYGGSINDENSQAIFKLSEVDGGLIGSASLDANKIAKIVK